MTKWNEFSDTDIVIELVQQKWRYSEYSSKDLKNDRKIVRKAIEQDVFALQSNPK